MKLLSKIAILAVLIAFVSSCQKEKLPVPGLDPSQQDNTANQRVNSPDAGDTGGNFALPVIKNKDQNRDADEIVGGGDDDRDGGSSGSGKKEKKN